MSLATNPAVEHQAGPSQQGRGVTGPAISYAMDGLLHAAKSVIILEINVQSSFYPGKAAGCFGLCSTRDYAAVDCRSSSAA